MFYVIRNCPAIYGIDDGFLCSYREDNESEKYCRDFTDCVMKQIVEKCKNIIKCDNCELNGKQECMFANCTGNYVDSFANDLLQLLDIQEVE